MKRTSRWNEGPMERLETLVRLDQYGRKSPGPALQALRALKRVFAAVERMRPYTPGWEDRAIKAWDAAVRLSRSPARKERR